MKANDFEHAWDGKINGKVIPGQYFVDLIVELPDGTQHTFETEVCNYPCGLYNTLFPVEEINCGLDVWWVCRHYQDECYDVEPGCFE